MSREVRVDAQEIVQQIQARESAMSAADARKIVVSLRAEAEQSLTEILAGVLLYHKAQALAQELEVLIGGAETTAETATRRYNKLQQESGAADYAVRKAKADKIMLPGNAPKPDVTAADRAIREAERALKATQGNLQAAKKMAVKRHRELDDLRATHRALAEIRLPDLTPLRVLLDALQ